jgi:hypothetical protein
VASRRCLPVATVAFVAVVPALGALVVVEAVGLGAAGLAGAALVGCCCSSLVASRRCLPGIAALTGVLAALEEVTVPAAAGLAAAAGLGAGLEEDAVTVCCSSLVASRRCLPVGLLDAAATGEVVTFLLLLGRWAVPALAA